MKGIRKVSGSSATIGINYVSTFKKITSEISSRGRKTAAGEGQSPFLCFITAAKSFAITWFLLPMFLEQLCRTSPAVSLELCSTNQSWLAHGIAELERQYHARGRKEIRVSFSRNACWTGSHEKIIPTPHSCPELKAISYCMNIDVFIHPANIPGRLSNAKVLHARKKYILQGWFVPSLGGGLYHPPSLGKLQQTWSCSTGLLCL